MLNSSNVLAIQKGSEFFLVLLSEERTKQGRLPTALEWLRLLLKWAENEEISCFDYLTANETLDFLKQHPEIVCSQTKQERVEELFDWLNEDNGDNFKLEISNICKQFGLGASEE